MKSDFSNKTQNDEDFLDSIENSLDGVKDDEVWWSTAGEIRRILNIINRREKEFEDWIQQCG